MIEKTLELKRNKVGQNGAKSDQKDSKIDLDKNKTKEDKSAFW